MRKRATFNKTSDIQVHNTYINLVAEGSVWAILELALVVCGVADTEASQWCGEVPLGRTIIQTETPAATKTDTQRCDSECVTFLMTKEKGAQGVVVETDTSQRNEKN